MLDNFIFSLNAVMPMFLMMFLGYVLRKTGFLTASFFEGGTKFVFYIGLPALLFQSVRGTNPEDLMDLPFIAFVMGATLTAFAVIWAIAAIFIKDKRILGAFVQGAFRGNTAFLGIPFLGNLAGEAGLARAALIITVVMPLYNICSVLVLAACADSGEKIKLRYILLTVAKNPLIIGIILGIAVMLLGIQPLPSMLEAALGFTTNMATPMALICLGGGIVFQGFDKKFKFALLASFVKVLILPLIFLSIGYALNFRGVDLAAILMAGGMPSAIAGYVIVVQMGGDGYTAGTIVVISTLLSALALTMFVYVMRVAGIL